ncbi:MAG: hypothetical protein HUJ54_13060 [Erysipelotrichaceae bacterium]|nr:hypothetical protein [Erysipelotrichaceae bacterium]
MMVSVRLDQYMGDSVRFEMQGLGPAGDIAANAENSEPLIFVLSPSFWKAVSPETLVSLQINAGLDPLPDKRQEAVAVLEEMINRFDMTSVILRDRNKEVETYIGQIRITAVIFAFLMITVLITCLAASLLQIQAWLVSQRENSRVLIREGMSIAVWSKTIVQIYMQYCYGTGFWCILLLGVILLCLWRLGFLVWQSWLGGLFIPLLTGIQILGVSVLVKQEAKEIQI